MSKKDHVGREKTTPTKALPLRFFETGLERQSSKQCA